MAFNGAGIGQEARLFRVKFYQTPSFLFLIMGISTIIVMLVTFFIAKTFDDVTFLILSTSTVTGVVFVSGVILVRIISKIIIINAARTEFLSLVTHQLRSPLTGMKYIFELALSQNAGELTPTLKEVLRQGAESNQQMLMLVSDLLDMSKMAEGDSPYEYEKVEVKRLIKEVYEDLAPNAQEKNITVQLHIDETDQIKVDPKKISFAIQNLLDNAIKYTPEHGTVTVKARQIGKRVKISIIDTGIGVPLNEQDRLFTRFYRATNAEKTKKTGTGLGLYIVKTIIERHGGSIQFESELNKGSTFTILLPLRSKHF